MNSEQMAYVRGQQPDANILIIWYNDNHNFSTNDYTLEFINEQELIKVTNKLTGAVAYLHWDLINFISYKIPGTQSAEHIWRNEYEKVV